MARSNKRIVTKSTSRTDSAFLMLNYELNRYRLGEFLALKLTTNAAIHVGLDILGAAAKRVRNFRPSGTT